MAPPRVPPRVPLSAASPPPPPPGAPGDPGVVEPDGAYRRLTGDRRVLAGGAAAILLQIAHPLVGAGVVAHSGFRDHPGHRLLATLDAALTVGFGDTAQAHAAAAAVGRRHAPVRGTLPAAVGGLPAGTAYDARDPDLALWVHATLVRTALEVHDRYGRPPSRAEREEYYRQSTPFARLFRVPEEVLPATWADFEAYWEAALPRLAVSPAVREVAEVLLHPRLLPPLPGAGALLRAVTADLLPEPVRTAYGLPLTPARSAAVGVLARAVRPVWPRLPRPVREFPHAELARRRLRAAGAPGAAAGVSPARGGR